MSECDYSVNSTGRASFVPKGSGTHSYKIADVSSRELEQVLI